MPAGKGADGADGVANRCPCGRLQPGRPGKPGRPLPHAGLRLLADAPKPAAGAAILAILAGDDLGDALRDPPRAGPGMPRDGGVRMRLRGGARPAG